MSIPEKYKENIRFRKFIKDISRTPEEKLCVVGINYKIKLFAYGKDIPSKGMYHVKYNDLSMYSLFDMGFTQGWYKFNILVNRVKINRLTIILDDVISGEKYWTDLTVGVREDCLNIKNIDIPFIDSHENFLKLRMIQYIVDTSDFYEVDKIYRYRDKATNVRWVYGILLKKRKGLK